MGQVWASIPHGECFLASALNCNPWNFVPLTCCGGCAQHTPFVPKCPLPYSLQSRSRESVSLRMHRLITGLNTLLKNDVIILILILMSECFLALGFALQPVSSSLHSQQRSPTVVTNPSNLDGYTLLGQQNNNNTNNTMHIFFSCPGQPLSTAAIFLLTRPASRATASWLPVSDDWQSGSCGA